MKFALITLSVFISGLWLLNLAGCQTESPGTTDTLGSYTTMIDSSPDKVTVAAQKAANDLNLLNVIGNGTAVDGRVTAKDAQGDDVTIDIEQAGQNVSQVKIRIGVTGDESISKQLVDRIRSHLSWF
jgi:hypothetical protein